MRLWYVRLAVILVTQSFGADLWMLLTEFRCWRPKLSPTHLVSNNRHQYHPLYKCTDLYKSNWPDKLSWKQQLLQLYYRNAHLVIQGNQHSMFSIQNNRLMCTFHDKGLSFVSLTTQVCPSLSGSDSELELVSTKSCCKVMESILKKRQDSCKYIRFQIWSWHRLLVSPHDSLSQTSEFYFM